MLQNVFMYVALFGIVPVYAQTTRRISIDDAVKEACLSPMSQSAEIKVAMQRTQKNSYNLPPTEISYGYGQYHSTLYDKVFVVKQNFGSPLAHLRRKQQEDQMLQLAEAEQRLTIKQIIVNVKTAFYNQVFEYCKLKELKYQIDKLAFLDEELRVLNEKGDSSLLDLAILETRYAEVQNDAFQAEQEWLKSCNELKKAVYTDSSIVAADTILELYAIMTSGKGMDKFRPTSQIVWYQKQEDIARADIKTQQARLFPEITASYFNQEIYHSKGYQGFSVGVTLPLWFVQDKNNIEKARLNQQLAKNETQYQAFVLIKTIENLKIQLDQLFVTIGYFRENALRQADLIEKTADVNRQSGKMPALDYLDAIRTASKIRIDYLQKLRDYNATALQLELLIN
jgi:cobalt-zinc-cadmium resistance protein CzcA